MMTLLNGQTLNAKVIFPVERMQMTLEERNSTATITVGPEAPDIVIGDWIRDDTEPGRGIVWRVKTVSSQVETKTRTITLEQMIQSLKDGVMFGEVTPATMAGGTSAVCTARQAFTYILSQQSIWRLGDVEVNPSNPYSFSGENLFAAAETVTSSIDGAQWEYDYSSLPFTMHIRRAPSGFASEMRMSRNITTIRTQIDRSRMYTRLYPIGKNNLNIDGLYISRNENLYGVISKVETDEAQDTKEKLRAWAEERLKRHCEPTVTVTVTGLDLSADTGEALDHIVVGRRCRLPLPEYGTTINEKVIRMNWGDKIREPEKVTVTLANTEEDVASIIRKMNASSARRSKAGAKQGEEDHAWFVDTNEHVGMVAEAVAGPGAEKDWSRVSECIVDGQGIHQRVTSAEGTIAKHQTDLEQNEKSIGMVVKVNKDGTRLIKAGEICLAINDDGSSDARIEADHIRMNGDVNLSNVMTVQNDGGVGIYRTVVHTGALYVTNHNLDAGNLVNLENALVSASVDGNVLTITDAQGNTVNFSKATTLSGGWDSGTYAVTAKQDEVVVGTKSTSIHSVKVDEEIAPAGTNVRAYVKVHYATGNPSSPSEDTGFTRQLISLSGQTVWNNGYDNARGKIEYPSTAPAGQERTTFSLKVPNQARDGQDTVSFTLSSGTPAASGYVGVQYGADSVARIQVGNWWQAGYDNARGKIEYPSAVPSGEERSTFKILVPNAMRNGQDEVSFTLTAGTAASSGYAAVKYGPDAVAKINIGSWYTSGYENGWDDARRNITYPSAAPAGQEQTSFILLVPNAARDGQDTVTFSLSAGTPAASGFVGVQYGADTVGRIQIGNWYTSGWNAGYDDARGKIEYPSAAPSGQEQTSFSLKVPNQTRDGKDTVTFTLSSGTPASSGYVGVQYGADSVARIQVGNWYTSGWNGGYDKAKEYTVMPAAGTYTTFVVKVPNDARTGSDDKTFTIQKGSTPGSTGYASVALNNNIVGRISIGDWYTSGWNDGYDKAKEYTIMPAAGTDTTFVVKVPNDERTGSDDKTFTIQKGSTPGSTGYASVALNNNIVGRISIGDWYTSGTHDGWDLAWRYVDPPGESTASDSFVIGVPASNYNTASSYTFTLGVDDTYVYARNAANQVVARKANPAYTNGYQSAQALALPAWSWDGTDNWIGTNIGNQKYKISLNVFNNTVGVANADGYQISGSPAIEVSPAFVYDVENRQTKIHCTVGDDSTGLNNDWIYWLQWRSSDRKVIMCDSNGQINGSAECSVPEATVAMMIIENKNSTPSYTPYTMIDGMNNIDPGMRGIISVDGKYYAIQTKSVSSISRYKFGPYSSKAAMKRAMGISNDPPLMFDSEILEAGRYYAISVTDGIDTKRYYFRTPSAS